VNRRGFLKLFAGAAAGAIVVPKVSYFFAPQGGWQYGFADGGWISNGAWTQHPPGIVVSTAIYNYLASDYYGIVWPTLASKWEYGGTINAIDKPLLSMCPITDRRLRESFLGS
jgi:hypothetical protein